MPETLPTPEPFRAHLLIGSYNEPNLERVGEFRECLRRNCQLEQIVKVHRFLEDENVLGFNHPKVEAVPFGKRLQFADLFEYANRVLSGQPCIIANSDIFFDETLDELAGYILQGKLLCVSRLDVQLDGTKVPCHFAWTQDVWIFLPPLPVMVGNFYLGRPGCENRVAYEASQVGLQTINPCQTIHCNHLHLSEVRNWNMNQREPGPSLDVPCQTLRGEPPTKRVPLGRDAGSRGFPSFPHLSTKGGKWFTP